MLSLGAVVSGLCLKAFVNFPLASNGNRLNVKVIYFIYFI